MLACSLTDLYGVSANDQKLITLGVVVDEYEGEPVDLDMRGNSGIQPEVDHASVRRAQPNDKPGSTVSEPRHYQGRASRGPQSPRHAFIDHPTVRPGCCCRPHRRYGVVTAEDGAPALGSHVGVPARRLASQVTVRSAAAVHTAVGRALDRPPLQLVADLAHLVVLGMSPPHSSLR